LHDARRADDQCPLRPDIELGVLQNERDHRQRLSQAHVVRQYPAGRVLRLPPEEPREGLPLVREELKVRMLMYEGFSNQISPPLASNAD